MSTKTTSLEISKLLKEAGVRQDTEFKWSEKLFHRPNELNIVLHKSDARPSESVLLFAAFTTDELLEELPYRIGGDNFILDLVIHKNSEGFTVGYRGFPDKKNTWFKHESLPEALAQMYLWLKKEGLYNA